MITRELIRISDSSIRSSPAGIGLVCHQLERAEETERGVKALSAELGEKMH